MRCLEIMQQRGHRNTPILVTLPIAVDREIHYCEEGVCVHVLVFAYFLHRLVAKAQVDSEASQTLKDVVIVGDECNHLIVGLVHFLITHDTTFLYLNKYYKKRWIAMLQATHAVNRGYFAYATERVSRITVIFTCPGYVISFCIFVAISPESFSVSLSSILSAPTMTRSSRPA